MADHPVVTCPMGDVKGRKCLGAKRSGAKDVYRFSGIPFAKPPVGELRFEPPQKAEAWKGVLDGTKIGNIPVQQTDAMTAMQAYFLETNEFEENFEQVSEDCLYLKVYTNNPKPGAKMPVMYYIYGGGFQMGSTTIYDGSILASLHDVVVVMANYRVNVFGLLSFPQGETSCNGNMALMDQAMGMEWVRDNIEAFGGDPGNVTIFGESAGSGSVNLHVLSDYSRHLFHKAICHSGHAYNILDLKDNNDEATNLLCEDLKIDAALSAEAKLQKLKEVSMDELLAAFNGIQAKMQYFAPNIDGAFVKERPDVTIDRSHLHKVPFMIGVNSTEMSGMMAPGQDKGFGTGLSEEDGKQATKDALWFMYTPEKFEKIFEPTWKFYSSYFDDNDKHKYSRMAADIMADTMFVTGSSHVVRKHADTGAPCYVYKMNQRVRFNHEKEFNWGKDAVFKPDVCECDHGDDLYFTFGMPLSKAKLSLEAKFDEKEKFLSLQWMNYLTNFATTGDPNKGSAKVKVNWERFSPQTDNYLLVNDEPQMKENFHVQKLKFWMETVPKLTSGGGGTKF